mmetsp:Transcript_37288/g.116604  ORF Transcript_37288/g.116604 Transcript_37288/m.116604 type:complete len:234 (-) Transcript_37288:585-1286(-)
MGDYTPDDVLQLDRPTTGFLCPFNANVFGIEFLSFEICDYESKARIFRVGKDMEGPTEGMEMDIDPRNPDSMRTIRYNFSEDVLRMPVISTSLVFSVGGREIDNFRMIERHYFRDQLVKSYDFTFGFCIPGSTNEWEAVYAVPGLDESLIEDMINHPYETRSDSFYFANDTLIMHNKASYKYTKEDGAQAKSYAHYNSGSKSRGVKGGKGTFPHTHACRGKPGGSFAARWQLV